MSKEFKKYTDPFAGILILSTLFWGFFSLIGLLVLSDAPVVFPLCLVFLLISLLPLREGRKFWKSLEADPKLAQLVEEDFRNATPMMNGRIRLGKLWIYSRHGARLLGYDDISQVYQHVNRYLFFEVGRWLECRTVTVQSSRFKSKKTLNLCRLKLRGKSDAELLELFRLLESKNPNIKFGYQ